VPADASLCSGVWRAVGQWVMAAMGEPLCCGKCSEEAEAIFFMKSSATELMQMQQQQHRQLHWHSAFL